MINGIVSIVGRPNVGKSTLFNKMTHTRRAIVDDMPGVTRDRLYGNVFLDTEDETGFTLIDTGGFETKDLYYQPFSENVVWQQTEIAIEESDLVILLLDAKSGIHMHDQELARYLEKKGKRFLCVVNKIDGLEQKTALWDFFEISEDLHPISAAHSRGVRDLIDDIEEEFKKIPGWNKRLERTEGTNIAIIGKPNAGKSSVINRLLGKERTIVSEVAGTTRDSTDTPMIYNKKKYILVDTAGIRRRAKVKSKLESLTIIMSMKAVERADVVLLVLDASDGLTDQDMRLASLAISQYKPLIFVVNKWDLVQDKTSNTVKEYTKFLHDNLRDMSYVPAIFISCLQNQRVHKLMEMVETQAGYYQKRIETSKLNEALARIVGEHNPALINNHTKQIKFFFATQVRTSPPTIVVFCNVAKEIQEAYKRYITNRFRTYLGFDTIPIRVLYRGKDQKMIDKEQAKK